MIRVVQTLDKILMRTKSPDPFVHSDLYRTPGVVPAKLYAHECQKHRGGCGKGFTDGSHNTILCDDCKKKRKHRKTT